MPSFPHARSRLSVLTLLLAPASLLAACGDEIQNHFYYYGEGGEHSAGAGTSEEGGAAGEKGSVIAGNGGTGEGGEGNAAPVGGEGGAAGQSGGSGGGGAGGDGPTIDPNYPDAPIANTPTARQTLDVFGRIGNRYWFAVTDEERQQMNELRHGGGQEPGNGDPYHPGSVETANFVDHLWATTAGDDPQIADYGKVEVKVVGESTWRSWDEFSIPNLNVDANQFVKKQRIGGFEHLRFNNAQVGTIFRERFTLELFRRMGYPAPLATYAWVSSNVWGTDVTIPYVVVERYKQNFCERYSEQFGGGCANMWEFVGDFGYYSGGGEKDIIIDPGPLPGGGGLWDTPDNCQLGSCDSTRAKEFEQAVASTRRGEGFKAKLADFIDWPSFHAYQCLSWMLWVGDDALHNTNNVVIVERMDGLFQYLPYSVDISLGQDWYQNTPLTGRSVLAGACQSDPACWADTISTCEGLIQDFEDLKPNELLESIYDELDQQGMLRPGDEQRYEFIDSWLTARLENLPSELETFRNPPLYCEYPLVDCGGYCEYAEICYNQCVPPPGGKPELAGQMLMPGAGGGGGGEPCPVIEGYAIAH